MTIGPLLSRSSLLGIEARAGVESFAHHLCSALDLQPVRVRWVDGIQTAAISQYGDMMLADIGDAQTVTRSTLVRYAGFVLHELLHRKWTDFNARDYRPYVDRLHNALEDAWIERKAIRSGLTGNAGGLLHALIGQMVDEALAQVQNWADAGQLPFSLAIFARGYGVTVPTPAQVLPIWEEASARLDACQSSHETLELARWVFDQLQQQQQGQQQPQQKPDQQKPGQQGQQQADQGQDGKQGQEGKDGKPGQGKEADGQADGQAEGKANGNGQDGKAQGKPADAGPVSGEIKENTRATEVEPSLHQQYGSPGGTYSSTSVLNTKAPSLMDKPYWGNGVTVPPALRYQVRRLFENSAKEWREGGFKSGTLHRASLPKVMTGAREVFARRMSEDGVDSAVVILLDISSSMFPRPRPELLLLDDPGLAKGTRIDVAAGACIALMDTLAQAGAESMVIGFGEQAHILKTFSMPWRKAVPTLQRVALQGNTNDYAATRYATEALMRHPAERKVLMVLTDGVGNVDKTQRQAEAARALGITVIGIGIQKNATLTWGDDAAEIKTVADLGKVAFSKMAAA